MKSFIQGALAAGVAATALFNITPAQAAFTGCGAGSTDAMGTIADLAAIGNTCLVGDKLYTITDTTGLDGLTNVMISSFQGTQHSITIQNSGGLGPISGTAAFNYTIAVSGSPELMTKWQADTAGSLVGQTYDVVTNATGSAATSTINIPGNPGPKGPFDFTPFTASSNFTNTITNGAVPVQQLTNTVIQTPGPLPILGAGAAFGFSRRLRSRVKASA